MDTIRSKLLTAFLVCMSIPAVLVTFVHHHQGELRRLDNLSIQIEAGRFSLQKTHQLAREFFNFGQRDLKFFEFGESRLLTQQSEALAITRQILDQLGQVGSEDWIPRLEPVAEKLAEYEQLFAQVVGLLRERGFQDHGIVGEMRQAIHELESRVSEPDLLVHLLMLRRHEKDYIIRNQAKYIEALKTRSLEFQSAIFESPSLDRPEKRDLAELVLKYVRIFESLVSIDQAIGVRGGSGHYAELAALQDTLNNQYASLEQTYDEKKGLMTATLNVRLNTSIGLAILLSIALSLYLSSSLSRPLKLLSKRIREFVNSDFSTETRFDGEIKMNGEVGAIAQDFNLLQEAMRKHVASIRKMAYYDTLTGLASRGYLNRRLKEMIGSAKRRNSGFSLYFIDLDAFKDVNDSLGHEAGDQLLVEIGQRLKATSRESDFVARLGGDEFCVLLEDLTDEADVAQVAERYVRAIEQMLVINHKSYRPQASIGISRFPMDGGSSKELMQAGDNAMYAAKEAGHHRFEFFKSEMTAEAATRFTIAQELRTAFQEDQFVLHYQPQVSLATGEIFAWEALVRWQHPERGLLPPGDFLQEIERIGLIEDLGACVMNKACEQVGRWEAEGLKGMRVCVNISPRHLSDPKLVQTVCEAILNAKISPAQLELEVTESGIQSAPDGPAILGELQAMGVRVAIDDFGTGYSSLGSLKHLPIDSLKIDRSFVKDMANNTQDAVLLGTIMALGHALDFRIVAEGVEELGQVQALQTLDCDLVQGYFFSRPVSPDAVPEIVANGFVDPKNDEAQRVAPEPRPATA